VHLGTATTIGHDAQLHDSADHADPTSATTWTDFRSSRGLAPAIKLNGLCNRLHVHAGVLARIDRETKHARAGRPAGSSPR
jgi:polyphosphate kinase